MDELEAISHHTSLDRLFHARPSHVLLVAFSLIAMLVLIEWTTQLEVTLGIFYVLPVSLGAVVLRRRWQILLLAMFCAWARGFFYPAGSALESFLRFVMASLAYTGAGLFVREIRRNRELYLAHLAQVEQQQSLRHDAEEQLRVLAESSPAAIMTLDRDGVVLAANRAAHQMLGFTGPNQLNGQAIENYLPVLADALKLDHSVREFRTAAQCWGRRKNGSVFVAQTWFSTYNSAKGQRLAAIAVDASEEIRDREEQNLQLLLRNNRVLAGAVSHEIRNLCAAAAVVSLNLSRVEALTDNEDFRALQDLIQGLSNLASFELKARSKDQLTPVSLYDCIDRFQVVAEPAWEEMSGTIEVQIARDLQPVIANAHALLQIFLNLSQNSLRAVEHSEHKVLSISVEQQGATTLVKFSDSGPGVTDPDRLFQAFQTGVGSTGLGLYVSRALARSFEGELRFQPGQSGCTFELELRTIPSLTQNDHTSIITDPATAH